MREQDDGQNADEGKKGIEEECEWSTCLIVIHFHHILNEFKREMILEVAHELRCIFAYPNAGAES